METKTSGKIDHTKLTLGNLICLKGFYLSIVKSIDENGIGLLDHDDYYLYDIISGVPITDEILDELGFYCIETNKKSMMDVEYVNKQWRYEGYITLEKEDQDIHAECIEYKMEYSEEDNFDVHINGNYITCLSYVHEIQNLFKLIYKNTELEVKKLII